MNQRTPAPTRSTGRDTTASACQSGSTLRAATKHSDRTICGTELEPAYETPGFQGEEPPARGGC